MKKNSFKRNILIAVIALLSVGTYAQNEIAISSAEELQKIGCDEAYPLTGSYFLTGEIDLSEIDEWIPIGAKSEVDGNPAAFEGVFDGKGYAIKNLKISAAGDLKGLFGTLTNAVVKNLTLEVNIKTPNRQVGAVAGSMQGETQIERVSVKGSIEGLENVGGIVGRVYHDNAYELYNKIRNCAVDVHVKATTVQAGGIAGRTNSSLIVENVYVAGKIEAGTTAASQNAAGLVALMTYNFVQFFSSVVVADEITGGTPNLFYSNEAKRYPEYFEDLYARNDISLTYFDNDAKGGGAQIVRNDMLLAPERFRSQSFYQDTLLWDFENVWVMGDDGRPALRTTTGAEQVRTREKVKVACIGNSITENSTVEYAQKWPSHLQELLGKDVCAVRNYGTGGTCMLKEGNNSYWNLPRLGSVRRWAPDVVIIKLGTNDTTDDNWAKIASFKQDYIDFINLFKTANPNVKVYVCYPIPVINRAEKAARVKALLPVVDEVAEATGATVIDLYSPFIGKKNYYVDDLHPGAQGTALIATHVYNALNAAYWAEHPVAVSTVEDLRKIGNDSAYPLNGTYYLTNDIELPEGMEWIPIGAKSETDGDPQRFKGVLDGKGYSIKNLKISTQGAFKGLFGRLHHAVVKDLDLVNVDIKGTSPVGGVAGAMISASRIERVSVSGNIEAETEAGGIVGRVARDLENTGYNAVYDCYVAANVKATSMSTSMNTPSCAGGIAALIHSNTADSINLAKLDVQRVYVTGSVASAQMTNMAGNAAGILAFTDNNHSVRMSEVLVLADEITAATPNCFYSRRLPAAPNNKIEYMDRLYVRDDLKITYYLNDGGVGALIPVDKIDTLPLNTFKTKDFYTENLTWDFDNVWSMEEGELPVLRRSDQGTSTGISVSESSERNCVVTVSTGVLTIRPLSCLSKVNIFSLTGSMVYSGRDMDTETTIALPQGAYVLCSVGNGKIYVEKLIVK